ncbi:MAG: hypothetical protein ACI4UU_02125, partial [Clostridia bacterium]
AKYYSDLINSYAWDTAIIFIEAYSGDTTYATKKGSNIKSSIAKTGENADKRCNIQDMAGNVMEWSTESSTYYPCTRRGGYCGNSTTMTSYRSFDTNLNEGYRISFRGLLCVK